MLDQAHRFNEKCSMSIKDGIALVKQASSFSDKGRPLKPYETKRDLDDLMVVKPSISASITNGATQTIVRIDTFSPVPSQCRVDNRNPPYMTVLRSESSNIRK